MRYLREFAEEWKHVGDTLFRARFGKPALLGIGIHGELVENKSGAKKRPTVLTLAPADESSVVETEILRHRVWLVAKSDSARGTRGISFGRGKDNDLVIPEYSISFQHGEFRLDNDNLLIVDLGSYNGITLHGVRLEANQPVPIHDGAKLVLGRFQFTYLTAESFAKKVAQLAME